MNRAEWYTWHSWFGIKLAIFLCFVLLTGTLAVISNEIDWLANPAMRAQSLEANEVIAWQQMYLNAKAQTSHLVCSLNAPVEQGFSAMVLVEDEKGQRQRLYFDPLTGIYQGKGRWFNWQTVLRRIHRHLMLPITFGVTLVTLTSLIFLASLISGLVLHKQWFKGLWQKPRWKNQRILFGDLHKLLGLWSAWLLLLVSVTGLWYFIERWGGDATYPKNAHAESSLALAQAVQPSPASFQKMLKTSQDIRPDMSIKRILMPTKAAQAVVIEGQAGQLLVRDRANNIVFDPVSANVLSVRQGAQLSLHARISEAADPLHFGTWGGYSTKVLYFVFGLLLTALSITGTYIYAMRLSSRHKQALPKQRLKLAWHSQPIANHLATSLILAALIAAGLQTWF